MKMVLSSRIISLEWGQLEGKRPRVAGCNARLGVHGDLVRLPLLRIKTDDGFMGFGICFADKHQTSALLGKYLYEAFQADQGVVKDYRAFEYPLWDLVGHCTGKPVYVLAAQMLDKPVPDNLRVPCYDTSLYFDDLHLTTVEDATDFLVKEALEGYERGHRAFKMKVGRGARHLPLEEGTQRDIAIIRAVRKRLGPDVKLMIDANNGYNLNLARMVLEQTRDCNIFWLEEAFHEDSVLYHDLQSWLRQQGLRTLVSDGEGQADPHLLDWARDGLVNVVNYDIFGYGFTNWLMLGQQLDQWSVYSAPHHYGSHYGNYVACHLASAINRLVFIEWDEATTPGLNTADYVLNEGQVTVPVRPGFGLTLDEDIFRQAVETEGYVLSL